MTTKPQRIINIHGHLRHDQDIPARIKLWQVWNLEKFICLCLDQRWASIRRTSSMLARLMQVKLKLVLR